MNAKNLPLKFGFVAVLTAVCLWSLHTKGCRQGIDLKGGYSLIFEIRSGKAEIQRLEETVKHLRDELATAAEPRKKELDERIKQLGEEIRGLRSQEGQRNLADDMIRILKERIDPQGLRNLEWRPVGADRIEVRMPAGSEESRRLLDDYQRALDRLDAGNVSDRLVSRLLQADAARRKELLAGVDAVQRHVVEQLLAAYDIEQAARKALAAARQSGNAEAIKAAEANVDNAAAAYSARAGELRDIRIRPDHIQSVLGNYRTPKEAEALKKKEREDLHGRLEEDLAAVMDPYRSRQELLRQAILTAKQPERRSALEAELAAVKDARQKRQKQLDEVVAAYKAWANVRQTLEDPADLQRLIARAGVLEFRIVAGSNVGAEIDRRTEEHYREMLRKQGPEEVLRRGGPYAWFPIRHNDRKSFPGMILEEYAGKWYILLSNRPGYVMLHSTTGPRWSLRNPHRDSDEMGRLAVGFEFDEAGARMFYNLTSTHKGKSMAILLDNEVFSAPTIQSAISSRGIIQGRFTPEEVDEMIRLLDAGSLPARLNPNPVSVRTFGPQLGRENRQKGLRAAVYAMIAVAAFMMIYYLLAGAIADVALLLNIVLVLGAMSLLEAVFTLPGIAGVVLTIGMAVDANVLIFERLREEQAKGQSVRMALKNAYERAFSAIFDSNLTTLITCLILGWVGTLEVRGFAITLGLGVAFSMFTALLVTRWIFQFLLERGWVLRPLKMLQVIRVPQVNWMGKRHMFWALSATVIGVGIASLVWQGSDILGIEFSSGTKAVVQLREDALIGQPAELPNDEEVRTLFSSTARKLAGEAADKARQAAAAGNASAESAERLRAAQFEKLATSANVVGLLNEQKVKDFLDRYDLNRDATITREELLAAKVRPAFVDKLMQRLKAKGGVLTRAELAGLPTLSYEISTTETNLNLIQDAARVAFGPALKLRTMCEYRPAADEYVPPLGLTTDADGKARVEVVDTSPYREKEEQYVGGVAVVVKGVNPPLTEQDLADRVGDVHSAEGDVRDTYVIGLGRPSEGAFTSLAVLVKLDVPAAQWSEEARREVSAVHQSLERQQTMQATSFDAAIAGRAAQRALIAIVLSWVAIVLYLWLRFGSARWGLAAVICLVHDTLVVVGMLAATGWLYNTFVGHLLGIGWFRIDLAMVAAILTVIGYSVNDTIVVFDRIRENRGKLTTVSTPVINRSINQTLSRTLLTSATTLLVVFIMYVWGGEGIKGFNYALLIGIIFGTYSSVAIASPLLLGFRKALLPGLAEPAAA